MVKTNEFEEFIYKPIRSSARLPKFSPRIVILVPGGPSFGDKPVTTGFGAIYKLNYSPINKQF